MKATLQRAWNSTTLMSWASQFTRTGSLLLVLPLVLRRFSEGDVSLWYLFTGMMSMSALADFGFRGTFLRVFAFGAGGAEDIEILDGRRPSGTGLPNWGLIERLADTQRRIYAVTSLGVFLLLATAGSAAMWRPIGFASQPTEAWIAWAAVCVTAVAEFQGRTFKNYIEGMGHVAVARRIETLTRLGAILSSFAVLVFAPKLLNLVLVNRGWAFVNVARDWYLARRVNEGRWRGFQRMPFDAALFRKVWRPAWRSGIAGALSMGVTNMTGVIYAQFASASALASYLFAVKLMSELRNITYAPLYSKVPQMSRLRAQGDLPGLERVAARGINLSYAVFALGAVSIGLGSHWVLEFIGSRTTFVAQPLWWLLAIGYFANRISAMHMQVYQSTNHVVAHIWDGAAGGVLIAGMLLLVPRLGVYGFPLSIIAAYLGLYAAVALRYSYRSLSLDGRAFAMRFVVPPVSAVALFVALLIATA